MIEPERVDAACKAIYDKLHAEGYLAGTYDTAQPSPWEENADQDVKSTIRVAFLDAYNAFNESRPGRPCSHPEFHNTGRCGEMECSNYAEKHRHPPGWGEIK